MSDHAVPAAAPSKAGFWMRLFGFAVLLAVLTPPAFAADGDLPPAAPAAAPASPAPGKLEGLYANRSPAAREEALRQFGGTRQGQEAVAKCLGWLAKVQKPDGSWEGSAGHTGLALLVFLAHGETPQSDPYGPTVQKATQWLTNRINTSPSNPPNYGENGYGEGIAIYALAEACGMTRDPDLRAAMERGVDGIVKGQQPGGGFNYGYDKGARWDLSLAGWQFQALKAALAAGYTTPELEQAVNRACTFIKKTTYDKGKFGYASPGSGGNMTGVGTACLILLGDGEATQAKAGCDTIASERLALYKDVLEGRKNWRKDAGASIYGWYYDTQALFQRDKGKGQQWGAWRKVCEPVLTKNQHPDGYWEVEKGPGLDPSVGGRILASCWCCLQLEVYYRYATAFELKQMARGRNLLPPIGGNGGGVQ